MSGRYYLEVTMKSGAVHCTATDEFDEPELEALLDFIKQQLGSSGAWQMNVFDRKDGGPRWCVSGSAVESVLLKEADF